MWYRIHRLIFPSTTEREKEEENKVVTKWEHRSNTNRDASSPRVPQCRPEQIPSIHSTFPPPAYFPDSFRCSRTLSLHYSSEPTNLGEISSWTSERLQDTLANSLSLLYTMNGSHFLTRKSLKFIFRCFSVFWRYLICIILIKRQ